MRPAVVAAATNREALIEKKKLNHEQLQLAIKNNSTGVIRP
jgi:hypothetical protein